MQKNKINTKYLLKILFIIPIFTTISAAYAVKEIQGSYMDQTADHKQIVLSVVNGKFISNTNTINLQDKTIEFPKLKNCKSIQELIDWDDEKSKSSNLLLNIPRTETAITLNEFTNCNNILLLNSKDWGQPNLQLHIRRDTSIGEIAYFNRAFRNKYLFDSKKYAYHYDDTLPVNKAANNIVININNAKLDIGGFKDIRDVNITNKSALTLDESLETSDAKFNYVENFKSDDSSTVTIQTQKSYNLHVQKFDVPTLITKGDGDISITSKSPSKVKIDYIDMRQYDGTLRLEPENVIGFIQFGTKSSLSLDYDQNNTQSITSDKLHQTLSEILAKSDFYDNQRAEPVQMSFQLNGYRNKYLLSQIEKFAAENPSCALLAYNEDKLEYRYHDQKQYSSKSASQDTMYNPINKNEREFFYTSVSQETMLNPINNLIRSIIQTLEHPLYKQSYNKIYISIGYDRNHSTQKVDTINNDYKQTSNIINLNTKFNSVNLIAGLGIALDLGHLLHKNTYYTKINTNIVNLYSKIYLMNNFYFRGIMLGAINSVTEASNKNSTNSKIFVTQLESTYRYKLINNYDLYPTLGARFSYVTTPTHEAYEQKFQAKRYTRADIIASIGINTNLLIGQFNLKPYINITRVQKISKDATNVHFKIKINGQYQDRKPLSVQTKGHYTEFSSGCTIKYNRFNFNINGSYDIGQGFQNIGGSINVCAEL